MIINQKPPQLSVSQSVRQQSVSRWQSVSQSVSSLQCQPVSVSRQVSQSASMGVAAWENLLSTDFLHHCRPDGSQCFLLPFSRRRCPRRWIATRSQRARRRVGLTHPPLTAAPIATARSRSHSHAVTAKSRTGRTHAPSQEPTDTHSPEPRTGHSIVTHAPCRQGRHCLDRYVQIWRAGGQTDEMAED